jgi:glycosyltransferase involved in cell wall biosynthesis
MTALLDLRQPGKRTLSTHLRECVHPWRWLTKPLKLAAVLLREGPRGAGQALAARIQYPATPSVQAPDAPPEYEAWRRYHAVSDAERAALHEKLRNCPSRPLFEVALAVDHGSGADARRTLASLARQSYANFKLSTVGAAENAAKLPNGILERSDVGHIIPLDAGDELADDALLMLAAAITNHPDADVIYSDEDSRSSPEDHLVPFCKPDWSPETFLAQHYLGRLTAYSRNCCARLGGFRPEFEGAQEYELLLRVIGTGRYQVVHVPRVLCTRREQMPPAPELSKFHIRALQRHADSLGLDQARTTIEMRPRFTTPRNELVSIVIPTAGKRIADDGRFFAEQCVDSIRRLTTYPSYEIILVDNGDLAPSLESELIALGARLVTFTGPFNLALKINLGVGESRGRYLVLLNDDTQVISPGWLESMLEYAARPEIGAVGAKLYFPDGRLQHVGVVLLDGNPSHPWYAAPEHHEGYFRSTVFPRNFLAVTGACLMTRREVFDRAGGFDPLFPLNYNDVDFCLRVQERDLRVVWTPYAKLYHHEAVSKEGGATVRPEELERFKDRWAARYRVDPYYSPNLSPRHCDYRLRGC